MDEIFLEKLQNLLPPENILKNERLSKYTTFRIGGIADWFVMPQSNKELKQIFLLCKEYNIPYKVIGNGSNLLFSDNGYRGLIIKNEAKSEIIFQDIDREGKEKVLVTVDSGMLLPKFAHAVAEYGLTGYEFAAGIPGTIGGAIVMNAGAYGGEIGDYIESVLVLDAEGEEHILNKNELSFSYRHSIIKELGYIIIKAVFLLEKGDKESIYLKIDEFGRARKEKQPLEYPSAGSAFKRPEGNYAGKLIMEAGLAGYRVGGAQVSTKHCGFVINTGEAEAADVKQLLSDVQRIVKEHSGIELETEIEFVGEFT